MGEWRRTAGPILVAALLATGLAADRPHATDGPGAETRADTVAPGTSGSCPPSDGPARRCGGEAPPEPTDPEARCYEGPEGRLAAPADVEICIQRLVDDGVVGADVLAELRCTAAYEAVPADVSADDYAEAGAVFERCMVAAATAVGPTG